MLASIGCICKVIRVDTEKPARFVGGIDIHLVMDDTKQPPGLTCEDLSTDLALDVLATPTPLRPVRRVILAVDIENSTTRNNSLKACLRRSMYDLVERSLTVAGIGYEHHDPLIDRGDGVLALVRQSDDVPIVLFLDTVVPTLSRSLNSYNERYPDRAMRLRAVLHAGEILHDGHGCFGQALDLAFRLLDSPDNKAILHDAWPAPLALIVSEDIYRSAVTQGYPGIVEHLFEPRVRILLSGRQHTGWTYIPAAD